MAEQATAESNHALVADSWNETCMSGVVKLATGPPLEKAAGTHRGKASAEEKHGSRG
jgi:hypothetical protein